MQFTIAAAAVLAFANSVFAQNPDFNPVYKPESGEEIDAGTTYTIEWDCPDEFADVTIKISLIGGATQEGQVPLLDIASGVNNSDEEYTWEIPSDIGGEAFYGLVLTSEANPADFQFSNPFVILAGEGGGDDDDDEEGESKSTTTITASQGTATVTLSKAEVTSSAISSSSVESSSEIPETSSAPVSSSAVASTTTVAQTSTVVEDEPEETTEPDTVDEEDESSAARAHAGMLALVAGVAAAAFML